MPEEGGWGTRWAAPNPVPALLSFWVSDSITFRKNPPPAVTSRVDCVALAEGVPQPHQASAADLLHYNALHFPPLTIKIQAWMVLITPTVPECVSMRGELEGGTPI